jgi:hypothetical protein
VRTGHLSLVLAVAGSDCERVGDGLLAQPANTWSSAAFLLAAGWIALRARRSTLRRTELLVFAAAVAANALGGLFEHGTSWPGARWVHDLAILAVLGFIAVFGLARRLDRPARWTVRVLALALGVGGALLAALPDSAYPYPLFTLAGIGAVGGELLEYRHETPELRREELTARRAARLGVAVALLLGGTAFWVGRSGAPLCNPASAFQWHAVWHVLSALAMALYAYGAIESHAAGVTRSA